MELQKIECEFSVCKIGCIEQVDFSRGYVFLHKTPDEVSLVCESAYVPPDCIAVEAGWRALMVSGVLDFSLVGIIAGISRLLTDAGISIFVVSTYNTDYVLLKDLDFDKGVQVLISGGYVVV